MPAAQILIVEDAAIIAEDLAARLKAMGYNVVDTVASGEAAIARIQTIAVDLVLMDIILQGEMDGVEAAQWIYTHLGIPVIYLTANGDDRMFRRVQATAPHGFLLKPFKSQDLRAAIEIALARRQVESQMQQALTTAETLCQEAQTYSQQQSEYLSIASHEFRSPLSVIRLATRMLQDYSRKWSETKRQHYLQRIQANAETLNQMIDELLLLGKVESGRIQLNRIGLNLERFCQEIINTLKLETDDRHTLTLIVAANCPVISTDPQLLWQLLHNLLVNAIKYSPEGGTVSLSLSASATFISLQIQDQGIGIPLEDLPRLFQPFQRASNVGTIPGTGLGLAIARRSADLLGGEIAVASTVGEGTIFTVTLPLSTP